MTDTRDFRALTEDRIEATLRRLDDLAAVAGQMADRDEGMGWLYWTVGPVIVALLVVALWLVYR